MDESVVALLWLVSPSCPPDLLEQLQTKMAANVQAAMQFGMQSLAERERKMANAH